jgi:hypothetical protein
MASAPPPASDPVKRLALVLCGLALAGAAPAPRAAFLTLGTGGGPLTRIERSEPANAVVVDGDVYLFDVGDGAQRQLAAAKLPLQRVRAVFLSHHHVDHNTMWTTTGALRPCSSPAGC